MKLEEIFQAYCISVLLEQNRYEEEYSFMIAIFDRLANELSFVDDHKIVNKVKNISRDVQNYYQWAKKSSC